MRVKLFEEQVSAGWVYPCTLQELEEQLQLFPNEAIEGLWAVGLIAATRRKNDANARYVFGEKPNIGIYSFSADLRYRLPSSVKDRHINVSFVVERTYGMTIEKIEDRFFCCWSAERLRFFILDYVLRHEVGHHLFWMRSHLRVRKTEDWKLSEAFAEDYAQRNSAYRQLRVS